MGYNLSITRARDWADEDGPKISREEWLRYVEGDPELRAVEDLGKDMVAWSGPSVYEEPWIRWSNGQLDSKNPDPPLIEKMVAIASALGARVLGEEGEEYLQGGEVRRPRRPGFFARVKQWILDTMAPESPGVDPVALPFKVGDRVKSAWGREGVVTRIDLEAERGLGRIEVRFDDGQVMSLAAVAHGLEPAGQE